MRGSPIALVAALLLASAASAVDFRIEKPNPTRGEPVAITLTGAEPGGAYRLLATYRPGSRTEKREVVGDFDETGVLRWTPADAGITRLVVSGPDGEELAGRNVAVRFDSPPLTGFAIFLLAGALLFGGATTAVRRSLEGGD